MIKHQLFIGAALIAGVAIGYFAAPAPSPVAPAPETEFIADEEIADNGASASLAALRARIAELEAQLAKKGEDSEELVSNAVARIEERRRDRGGWGERRSPREFVEEMQKNHPEQFVQMTNRVAQWRQSRLDRQQSKLDYLAAINTSGMNERQRESHEKLQDLIVRHAELEEQLHDLDMSDEDRRRVFEEMREVDRTIGRLNDEERRTLLGETAKALGLGDEDAQALTDTVQDILEVTENSRMGPPGGMGGPGGQRGGRRGR